LGLSDTGATVETTIKTEKPSASASNTSLLSLLAFVDQMALIVL